MTEYQTKDMLIGRINAHQQLIKQSGNEIKQLESVLRVRFMNENLEPTREEEAARSAGGEVE